MVYKGPFLIDFFINQKYPSLSMKIKDESLVSFSYFHFTFKNTRLFKKYGPSYIQSDLNEFM